MEFGIITALLVITIYVLIVILLWKSGLLARFNIGAMGPLLMVRTRRGLSFLDRLALRARFWRWYGNFSIALVFFFMGLVSLILLWEVPLALRVPASAAPGPEYIVGIPGINPLIPIGYGILALAVAILVHEVAHGILTRVAKVTVKSAGLLLFVVPIGAFVEPDDDQLKQISRRKRIRMYSVGPATNLLLAVACAAVFSAGFMSSVEPVEPGVIVTEVVKDYPADNASIPVYSLITDMNLPNSSGPEKVGGASGFQRIISASSANDTIAITYLYRGDKHVKNVTLADKYDYYEKYYPQANSEEYKGKGFLGVGTQDVSNLSQDLARPMKWDSLEHFVGGVLYFVGLPFLRLEPLDSPLTDLYHVTGPLSGLPAGAFWVIANTLYWLFWLNLVVGASNSLPIPRFDGGMVYLDGWEAFLARFRPKWTPEKRTQRALWIYRATGLVILFLILWQLIGPRVGALI
jgi:membrane-associated protease RseP (regulator of RpoE activity)